MVFKRCIISVDIKLIRNTTLVFDFGIFNLFMCHSVITRCTRIKQFIRYVIITMMTAKRMFYEQPPANGSVRLRENVRKRAFRVFRPKSSHWCTWVRLAALLKLLITHSWNTGNAENLNAIESHPPSSLRSRVWPLHYIHNV